MRLRLIVGLMLTVIMLLSCEEQNQNSITHNRYTLNSIEQKIVFKTDYELIGIAVVKNETHSSEITESINNGIQVWSGDWFTLQATLHSHEVELYVDANEGEERLLMFSILRSAGNDEIVVIQKGVPN